MLNGPITSLGSYDTRGQHSISGLSSGAFMTVQLHIAHSSKFVGAGVIAGGPYRSAETFREAAPGAPTSCILNSLYVAMTPLTAATAPDVDRLLGLVHDTPDIDDLSHIAKQRMYIFTGSCDQVVNQFVVKSTRAFYRALGVSDEQMMFVDDVPAGHSLITKNPEDSPLEANQPPYINRGTFIQSHVLLQHIYPGLKPPAVQAKGRFVRFEQSEFYGDAKSNASMAPFGYAYIPYEVDAGKAEALGVHIALHGCKQGYAYVNYVNGRPDTQNQPPYGARYMTTTGYLEMAESNNLIVLFPQVSGDDDNVVQNPDGCWDWWGYTAANPSQPDYYTQKAVQIHAIHGMLERLAGGAS